MTGDSDLKSVPYDDVPHSEPSIRTHPNLIEKKSRELFRRLLSFRVRGILRGEFFAGLVGVGGTCDPIAASNPSQTESMHFVRLALVHQATSFPVRHTV